MRRQVDERRAMPNPVLLYLATFFVVGLSLSVLGPALSQLRDRTGADIGDIGILFVGQFAGYLTGSFVGGRAYDRFDGHRVFAAALITLGVGLFLVPSSGGLAQLFGAFVIVGAGAAAADVGANAMIMWKLRGGVGRAMSALHLCFGLGALTAPLLVHVGLDIAMRSAPLACLVLACWAVSIPAPSALSAGGHVQLSDTSRGLLAVPASFFLLYVGLELGFAGWIHTYGEEIEFSDLAATWLTTTFWVAFTFGRLLSSLLASRVQPRAVLTGGCWLAVAAALVLVIGDGRTAAVWSGTALMGLATAPQFPVMLTYLERRIKVTGRATSWFVGAAGLGGLVFPWMIGRWFGAKGATALPWSMLVFGALTLGAFAASDRILGDRRRRPAQPTRAAA